MAYCIQCGNEVLQEARFCSNCGVAVGSEATAAESTPQAGQVQPVAGNTGSVPPAISPIPKEARNMAMLCHLASFAGFTGIPLGNILGPLLVWLIKRQESPFIDAHGKDALNFQINVTIYGIISFILILIFVGLVPLVALFIFAVISVIVAAVRANAGSEYRYRLTMRFIK